MTHLTLPAIPHALRWETPAVAHAVTAAGALQMSAGPQTDHFVDPRGAVTVTNSVRLLFQPDEQFMLAARAQGGLVATYDAAVLMLYGDERHWAKLCLELSPQGQPMIVSVVTNGVSDDCNSVVLDQADAYLARIWAGHSLCLSLLAGRPDLALCALLHPARAGERAHRLFGPGARWGRLHGGLLRDQLRSGLVGRSPLRRVVILRTRSLSQRTCGSQPTSTQAAAAIARRRAAAAYAMPSGPLKPLLWPATAKWGSNARIPW